MMKLISCYIANFGGLSDYECSFAPGLTMVEEPNGFGKTTLAEFIRAMFYGFPRAGKALEKNRRKKYLPWQGGNFGGSLVFEHEGIRYRIERSFGASPASDTFVLYDERTNQKSTRFSQDIGLEIFQLDADSFERSTYLPQLHSGAFSFSTDSIQAKLGDLVQDTNDVNNFESARTALKNARRVLIPYAGQGGSVAQAQGNVSRLEENISKAQEQAKVLNKEREELSRQCDNLEQRKRSRDRIQGELSQALQAEGNKAVVQRYKELCENCREILNEKETLEKKYPKGFPSVEQIDSVTETAEEMEELINRTKPSQEYLDAAKRCENEKRFESGTPSGSDFAHYSQVLSSYSKAREELRKEALTPEEEGERKELERFFSSGTPDDEVLAQCREARDKSIGISAKLEQLVADPDEEADLDRLGRVFASGVPSDDEIAGYRDDLERAGRLREENQKITVSAASSAVPQAPAPKKSKAYLVILVLGILSAIAGCTLLFMSYYLPGACLAGLGIVLLLVTACFRLKDMASHVSMTSRQQGPLMSEQDRQKLRENDQEIERLESSAEAFAEQYVRDGEMSAADKLREIRDMAGDYRRLAENARKLALRRKELKEEKASQDRRRDDLLFPYYGDSIPDEAESDLENKRREYRRLQKKKEEDSEKKKELNKTLARLSEQISSFLSPYFDCVAPDKFAVLLHDLEISSIAYQNDKKLVLQHDKLVEDNEQPIRDRRDSISSFAGSYGLMGDLTVDALKEIKQDMLQSIRLEEELGAAESERDSYYKEKQDIILSGAADAEYDREELEKKRERVNEDIDEMSRDVQKREERIRQLQETVDGIPKMEDERDEWKGKLAEGRKSARLLDDTIAYLEKAKENLSTSYLPSIRQAFGGYLQQMAGEDADHVSIDTKLDVTMDRKGMSRELGYFSVGQEDSVMLCMRFALVDVLFKDAQTFVILDDPFVNLDDAHTAAAVSLLKSIAENHQIIYLTCHSSRRIL